MKMIEAPSPHFNERALPINALLIHYTDMPSAEEALAWFASLSSQVSAHYLIDEKGQIYQLVKEDARAWHAGASYWQNCQDMNSCSIGIELANPGHNYGYQPFPEAQIESLLTLCQVLRTRWDIPASRILGHSDVAPRRKQDPGHLFPWNKLAQEGLGLWPPFFPSLRGEERRSNPGILNLNDSLIEALAQIGYETVSPLHTLLAFQRHFQPHKIDGVPDQETFSLLQSLLKAQETLI